MEINGLTLLVFAIVILPIAYFTYGRFLARSWRTDPLAAMPAYEFEDGSDYVPTRPLVVFGYEFSAIAGAGPFTGAIIASMFGWLPVILWLLLGAVFFGAMHDFLALYTSVQHRGKSIGAIAQIYLGETGRRIFLASVWFFAILCSAAFLDIVAGSFAISDLAYAEISRGALTPTYEANSPLIVNGSVASASMLFIFAAIGLGFLIHRRRASDTASGIIAIDLLVLCIVIGVLFPIYLPHRAWMYLVLAYIFISSVMPIWLLHQPRNYLNSFLLIALIAISLIGIALARPTLQLPAFAGWEIRGQYLFPALLVTVSCGAISGFHSLVVSNFTSRQVTHGKYLLPVSYGSMLLESLLATVALVAAGSLAVRGHLPAETPPVIFANGIAHFLHDFGLPRHAAFTLVSLAISAFILTTLDALARLMRLTFQDFFASETPAARGKFMRLLTSSPVASLLSLAMVYLLSLIGYRNIWTIFGASNQLLAALTMMVCTLFLHRYGKRHWMVIAPIIVMFLCTLISLVLIVRDKMVIYQGRYEQFNWRSDGLQLMFSVLLIALGILTVCIFIRNLLSPKNRAAPAAADLPDRCV